MRDNPDYALEDVEAVKELVRQNPWCTFVSHVPGHGLVASHYPVILDEDADGIQLLSHVGRPDEVKHELGSHEMLAIIAGPHGYISPGWYGSTAAPSVPTWNFTVAHVYGVPELMTNEENLAVLDQLVAYFESELPEPFRLDGTPEVAEYAARIVKGTVGFRMRVTRFEAKNKLNQDKSPAVVDNVVAALRQPGPYHNAALAEIMASEHERIRQEG